MWCIRQATDYKDCLNQVRQFTQKTFAAGSVTHSIGSVGRVYGASASENSVAETWTLVCNADLTTFTVNSPSETGTYPDATVGVPYSQAKVSFIIVDDGGTFTSGDTFTFPISSGATAEWVQDRWDTDYDGSGGYELIQHGIGAGSDEIYVGYNTKTDASTYWNWLVTGLTGYVAHVVGKDHPMTTQPGYFPYYVVMNDAPNSFIFYCIATSRHIKIIPLVGSSHGSTYTGWFLPHATPSQWTYPMFNGGSTDNESEPIGTRDSGHTCYWSAFGDALHGAVLDGTVEREINRFSPRHYGSFENFRSGLDQNVQLWPCVPIHESSNNVYGELEGVYWPSPYTYNGTTQGVLTPGSVIVSDDVTALCFQDVTADGAGNIIAMDLMGD